MKKKKKTLRGFVRIDPGRSRSLPDPWPVSDANLSGIRTDLPDAVDSLVNLTSLTQGRPERSQSCSGPVGVAINLILVNSRA